MSGGRTIKSMHSSTRWLLCAIVLALGLATGATGAEWRWPLDNARYKRMNAFERAQYDKAADLVNKKNYKAAAVEFEKFKLQFADSANLSYILFMRGYCLQLAKDRYAAIKAYQEVVDFFPNQTDDVAAALYHIGLADLENGDTLKSLQVLKRMAEDPRFAKHPLTAGALRQLAANHYRNGEFDQAVGNWRQIIRDFERDNGQARQAVNDLIACQTLRVQLPKVEQFLVEMLDEKSRNDPAARQRIGEQIWDQAHGTLWHYKHRPGELIHAFGDKITPEQGKAMLDWFVSTRPWWEQADKQWEWHERAAQTLVYFAGNVPDRQKLLEESVRVARSTKDSTDADKRLTRLTDICRDGQAYDLADYCIGQMHDRRLAQYKSCEILIRRNKVEEASRLLQELEGAGDAEWARRAKWSRAELYRHRLNRPEDAIRLYTEMNNPPDNLWAIQDCYMRMGRLEDSLRTLREIQNMFPDQAARTLWAQAENSNRSGKRKQAATYARALLAHYKDSPESSRAHQLLEDYGIKTGGGVINDQ